MAERLPDPEDEALDAGLVAMISGASGEGLRLPNIIRWLSPRAMQRLRLVGYTKPQIIWGLFRLWRDGKVVFGPLDVVERTSDLKKLMPSKVKGQPIGMVWWKKKAPYEGLTPTRPPRPSLPLKNWELSAEEYIKRGAPFTVGYGVGVDSTAMLVQFRNLGLRPDAITFADVGGEKPETIDFLHRVMNPWLRKVGFPQVTIVRYVMTEAGVKARPAKGLDPREPTTLEENCLFNYTLPSWAFGFQDHNCSMKWKVKPQLDWITNSPEFGPLAHAAWDAGLPVIRAIGLEAGEEEERRHRIPDDIHFMNWYPLQAWGWDRDRCIEAIKNEGIEVPLKSACFFCPSSKPHEIEWLVREHPDLADRIIRMEDVARPYLGEEGVRRRAQLKAAGGKHPKVKGEMPEQGLWFKGQHGLESGRMADFIQDYRRLCLTDPSSPRCKGWRPGKEYAYLAEGKPRAPSRRRLPILQESP